MLKEAAFELPAWLRSAHLQTLGAALPLWSKGARDTDPSEAVEIPIPREGGALHGQMTWQAKDGAPAVVLVHGVGGSCHSQYAVRGARALAEAGFHALRLNMRGAGESVRTAPSLYHAALTRDLATVVEWLSRSPRVNGVFVVGFSLGGHMSLRWAGELGTNVPAGLRGIASLSAPLDLELTTQAMERRRSAPYHRYIAKGLQEQGRAFARLHPGRVHYTERELDHVRSIRAYDNLVVAPMHGWKTAEDYYREASAYPLLRHISVPTILIHAEDDPMVPAALVHRYLDGAPSTITQAWSRQGGHVGWFSGLGEDDWVRTWGIRRVLEFFEPLRDER